jgi:hypothetical protein
MQLFRALIYKGKRDYIKVFVRICNAELKSDIYNTIRDYLFTNGDKLNASHFNQLCRILSFIFDLRKQNNDVVNKIISHIISQLERSLQDGHFNKTSAQHITVCFSSHSL